MVLLFNFILRNINSMSLCKHRFIKRVTNDFVYLLSGAPNGGGGVATPPEFWMGGVEHLSTPPPILRRFLLGEGGGVAPLKLI